MRLLEGSGISPFDLHHVLVVGGGARSPLVLKALRGGLGNLAGEQFVQDRLVVPRDEAVEELVVLGAAMMGSARN